jgi:O-methyltransferase
VGRGRVLAGRVKQLFTVVGARLPDRPLHWLQLALNYMRLGRWMRNRGFRFPLRVADREACWGVVAERVRDRKVLYLEFGVHKGASMRYWSAALRNPESRLHGFDSFEGLPEDFDVAGGYPKGRFSTGGVPPRIDDPRVEFFKGWFEDTLPAYAPPEHEVLVVTLDADLYSSTILVLNRLRNAIRPGTFLYFDDLSRPDHEPKAFDEFMRESGLRFRPVVADRSLNNAVFECVG